MGVTAVLNSEVLARSAHRPATPDAGWPPSCKCHCGQGDRAPSCSSPAGSGCQCSQGKTKWCAVCLPGCSPPRTHTFLVVGGGWQQQPGTPVLLEVSRKWDATQNSQQIHIAAWKGPEGFSQINIGHENTEMPKLSRPWLHLAGEGDSQGA